jgi:serine/threonine protein kinase
MKLPDRAGSAQSAHGSTITTVADVNVIQMHQLTPVEGDGKNLIKGAGAYGGVASYWFRSTPQNPGAPLLVVLKSPLKTGTRKEESRGAVASREISILLRLYGDSCFPSFLGMCHTATGPGIVMSALPKATLSDVLREKASIGDLPYRCALAVTLFDCIVKLHGYNIVHRDLKPNNILASSSSGKVWLIDFGSANDPGSVAAHGQTPGYRPAQGFRSNYVMPVDDLMSFLVIAGQIYGWDFRRVSIGSNSSLLKDNAHLADKQCQRIETWVEAELPEIPPKFAPVHMPSTSTATANIFSLPRPASSVIAEGLQSAMHLLARIIVLEWVRSRHTGWFKIEKCVYDEIRQVLEAVENHVNNTCKSSTLEEKLKSIQDQVAQRLKSERLCKHKFSPPEKLSFVRVQRQNRRLPPGHRYLKTARVLERHARIAVAAANCKHHMANANGASD